jgi:gluconate 2-dehydrogenase gamma chain
MTRRTKLSRRKFVQIATSIAAAAPLVSCMKAPGPWRFLTAAEARTLEAVCDRIIPADQDPGAAWAGVVNYIDVQLAGHYHRQRKAYREGIAGVDESSRAQFSKDFVALSPEEQDRVLKALESGKVAGEIWKKRSSGQFFAMVVRHTTEGFYGDPRHGGNRDRVSWRMVKLPYPPVRGRVHYDLTKTAKS